jgi:phage tail-like protein
MLMQSNKYIPEVYRRERDMQVFTSLIDILLTCCKYDIDSLYKIYDAELCPEQFLPYLADTINYKYDNSDSVTANRQVINVFMTMMRYKGCEIGIKMATALSLTSYDLAQQNSELNVTYNDYIAALGDLEIHYDYEKALIVIDYPNVYTQVRYLLDYVRPVGMYINLRSVVKAPLTSTMAILAQVQTNVQEYIAKSNYVNKAKVNMSFPTDEHFDDMLQKLYEETEENFNVIDLNN